jgi:hypothetical protein
MKDIQVLCVGYLITLSLILACAERKGSDSPPPLQSSPKKAQTSTVVPEKDTIAFQPVKEMLSRTCAPCHNPGGKMYSRLPFDDPQIVRSHSNAISQRIDSAEDKLVLEQWLRTENQP